MEEKEKKYIEMYKKMWLIRLFEENALDLFMKDMIRGSTHAYIGEEAIAVGVCSALQKEDYITSTHRGHGHCIAKGGDLNLMMAELFGRETGYCRGRGGSMHIANLDFGNLGANGIVGGGIGLATGAAFACKYRNDGGVAVCFFGDGAINQGVFYEAVNMAALWKLPVIYVCERNKFAEFSYSEWYFPHQDLTKRTEPFGFKGIEVDGNDLLAVYELTTDLVSKARNGEGPFFIVANTYRIQGHTIGDPLIYRIPGEVDKWKDEKHDPIRRFRSFLIKEEIMPADAIEEIEHDARLICEKAVKFAKDSPHPSPDSLMEDIYVL
jgi:TPP-dependent pyruvate/acetoin dehydrogenase alpha subunit